MNPVKPEPAKPVKPEPAKPVKPVNAAKTLPAGGWSPSQSPPFDSQGRAQESTIDMVYWHPAL